MCTAKKFNSSVLVSKFLKTNLFLATFKISNKNKHIHNDLRKFTSPVKKKILVCFLNY